MLAVLQTTSKIMRFFSFLAFLLVAFSVTEACVTGKTGAGSIRSSAAYQNPKIIEPADKQNAIPVGKINGVSTPRRHDCAYVTDNGAVSEAFALTNSVKRGYVLAPTLFSLMFSDMLMDVYRDESPGIHIASRTNGHLFNQRRMHFQSRVSTTTVHELLFADDCALNTTTEEDMQWSMDLFSVACETFGLVINTEKTVTQKALWQAAPSHIHVPLRDFEN
nr:unnamed protein product [Spirometra erinaceieuropaei]